MCLPILPTNQSYLLSFWSTLSEIDSKIKHQDTHSVKTTIQKSSAIFVKSTTPQNHSNFTKKDSETQKELRFFKDLDFLINENNAVITPYSTDHTYAKQTEPADDFVEKFTCKGSQSDTESVISDSNTESAQTIMADIPDPQKTTENNKFEAKATIKHTSKIIVARSPYSLRHRSFLKPPSEEEAIMNLINLGASKKTVKNQYRLEDKTTKALFQLKMFPI